MARIRDFAVTEQGLTTSTTIVCNMPVHVSGDALIYFASKDGNPVINATSGWTAIQDGVTAGCAYRCMFKSAASSAETLTVDTGTTENWTVVVISVEGCTPSSLANLIADSGGATAESGADDTAMPFAGPSDTTNADTNCLVIHAWFTDSGLSPTAYAPLVNVYAGDNGSNSVGVAYTYQRAAGSIPACNWFGRADDDGRGIVLAIKDASSDATVPGYSDSAVSSGDVIRPEVGVGTMFSDTWPGTFTLPALGDDFDYVQKDAAGTFTNYTTAANDTTANDVVWNATNGHLMYWGGSDKFQALALNVGTASTVGVIAWEYYNGSTWVSTGVTGNNLSATGWTLITLSPPAVAAMSQTAVNSQTYYWVRARTTTGFTVAPLVTQGRKGGRITAWIISTASADNGTNPYTDGSGNVGSTTATSLAGHEHQYGSALDLDTGILYTTVRFVLRRDGSVDPSFSMPVADPGGLQLTMCDASNLYASYMIHARGAKDVNPDDRNVVAIDWNGAATPWAVRGSVNKSAVTRTMWTSLGQAGAVAVVYSMFSLATRIGIAGGSSSDPLDFDDVQNVANNCIGLFPFIQRNGAAATIWVPLQFGGGDKVCVLIDKTTLQFPRVYDGVSYVAWNAATNVAGVKFYPKTNDVIKFTNCLFTSPSAYRWEWDASSATSGWTGDFTGTTVVGATVTLRAAMTFDRLSFISCPSFTQNAAVMTNCAFTATKVTSAQPGDADNISNSTFTSAGTGYAMEISGTAANMTLAGVTFTGYAGSNGSTGNEAVYVNIASGTMTITITGGGSTPSIRTAGATVTVVNARTVRVTALDADTSAAIASARVALWATTGATVTISRASSTASVAHTSHGYSNGQKVTIFGANQGEYNGLKTISNVTANAYDYTVSGTPTTPATGTITSHRVILDGDTNGSGIVDDTAFPYTSDLAVTGRVRKATSAPRYKTAPVSGTITSAAGFNVSAYMVSDA